MRRRKLFLLIAITFLSMAFICSLNLKSEYVLANDILKHGKKLYSNNNEELIIRDFFNDRRNGIFLDVGSSHYRGASNTYYLEEHLGWSGIAVDALAEFALGYIENRPNTRFFSFIVTDHSWSIEPFYRVVENPGLSSYDKGYLEGHKKYKPEWRNVLKNIQVVYVPTITLTDLLEKNGISKIDFLSMDIEGNEPAALAGFDIKKFKPELVCIERRIERSGEEVLNYFSSHDYELIKKYLKYDNINWYFTPKK